MHDSKLKSPPNVNSYALKIELMLCLFCKIRSQYVNIDVLNLKNIWSISKILALMCIKL